MISLENTFYDIPAGGGANRRCAVTASDLHQKLHPGLDIQHQFFQQRREVLALVRSEALQEIQFASHVPAKRLFRQLDAAIST